MGWLLGVTGVVVVWFLCGRWVWCGQGRLVRWCCIGNVEEWNGIVFCIFEKVISGYCGDYGGEREC